MRPSSLTSLAGAYASGGGGKREIATVRAKEKSYGGGACPGGKGGGVDGGVMPSQSVWPDGEKFISFLRKEVILLRKGEKCVPSLHSTARR